MTLDTAPETKDVPRGKAKANGKAAEPVSVPSHLLRIPLESIDIGDNVRVNVVELEELAASILEHGVIQPVKVVAATGERRGRYDLVYGQRRVLASRQAGQTHILAIVELLSSEIATPGPTRSIEQLIENLHRADLNPVDRARAMRDVVDAGTSQADLARKLGLAPSTVSNDLRMLQLDDQVLERVIAGEISPSHAKAIASLPPKQQREVATSAASGKMSAHQLEREIQWKQDSATQDERKAAKTTKWIPKTIAALEAADVAKGATVAVSGGYYDLDIEAVKRAVKAAGWKVTDTYGFHHGSRIPRTCDCTAVRIEVGGRKPEVERLCIDSKHQDRETNTRHVEEKAAQEARQAELKQLREALVAAFVAGGIPAPALRVLSFVLRRSGGGWSEWKDIPAAPGELIAAIANGMTQEWNLRDVPVGEVLEALAKIETPA